jgi:molybdopterin-containing oxidoreductase family iron-sulfur binding subunit
VKLEGNPLHPEWQGSTDVFLQAALLGLYDPDRSSAPQAFDTAMAELAATCDRTGGAGLALLTGMVTSPTLIRQVRALLARWPETRWHVHEPWDEARPIRAAEAAFGRPLAIRLGLDQADVVVSLGDDFLGAGPAQAVNARRWAARRAAWRAGDGGSRLLVAEPVPGITGAMAEDRLPLEPARLADVARGLAGALEGGRPDLPEREAVWVTAAARALRRHPGRALVTAGSQLGPELQAFAMVLTARLGGVGTTLRCTAPVAEPAASLAELAAAAAAGEVGTLVVLGANPLFTTPAAGPFRAALPGRRRPGRRLGAHVARPAPSYRPPRGPRIPRAGR